MQALWGSAQMAPATLTQLSSSGPAHSVQDGEAITYLCANQPLVVVLKFREIDPTPNTVGSMGQNMESSANGVPGVQFVHLRPLDVRVACNGVHDHLHCGKPAEVILIFDLVWPSLFPLLLPMKVLMAGSF